MSCLRTNLFILIFKKILAPSPPKFEPILSWKHELIPPTNILLIIYNNIIIFHSTYPKSQPDFHRKSDTLLLLFWYLVPSRPEKSPWKLKKRGWGGGWKKKSWLGAHILIAFKVGQSGGKLKKRGWGSGGGVHTRQYTKRQDETWECTKSSAFATFTLGFFLFCVVFNKHSVLVLWNGCFGDYLYCLLFHVFARDQLMYTIFFIQKFWGITKNRYILAKSLLLEGTLQPKLLNVPE